MKNDSPCYGCNNRYAGCHSKCEAYTMWSKDHIEKLRDLRKKIEAENTLHTYAIESGERIKKRRKRGNR